MKFYKIIAGVLLFTSFCYSQENGNDYKNEKLINKVKSVTTKHYEANLVDKKIIKLKRDKHVLNRKYRYDTYKKYDTRKKLIQTHKYHITGELYLSTNFLFNEKQNNTEEIIEYPDGHKSKKTYEYNDKNYLIKKIIHGKSYLIVDTYKYDKNGNLITIYNTDENNSNKGKETYKYDIKNQLIKKGQYYSDGSFSYLWEYKYDEKGNKIIEIITGLYESLSRKKLFRYDNRNNLTRITIYDIKESLIGEEFYQFDSKNNIIEERFSYPADKRNDLWNYKYEFDKNRNWIKRTSFKNNIVQFVTDRKIEYYE